MSAFWNNWIIVLVVANIVFALWLLRSTTKRKADDKAAGPETTGHVWDGDLQEYNNPLPRWWLWMFYLSIAFAVGYLVIYPGLGAYRGTGNWTQAGQWATEVAETKAATAKIYDRYQGMSMADLARDAGAMSTARHLFGVNCAQCHGADGHGAKGFPNLASANYQWGREPDNVIETITNGRQAQMPAWGPILGASGVEQVADYVHSLQDRGADPARVAAGKELFTTYCVACHGEDGHGMAALGAPNLTDAVWLYGGSVAAIRTTVTDGRQGQMPAHGARLTAVQIKLLAAYVTGLSDAGDAPGT